MRRREARESPACPGRVHSFITPHSTNTQTFKNKTKTIHTSHTSHPLHSHTRDVRRIPRSQTRIRVITPRVNPGSEPVQLPRLAVACGPWGTHRHSTNIEQSRLWRHEELMIHRNQRAAQPHRRGHHRAGGAGAVVVWRRGRQGRPRLRHLLRTVRPGLGDATFRDFDALIMTRICCPCVNPGPCRSPRRTQTRNGRQPETARPGDRAMREAAAFERNDPGPDVMPDSRHAPIIRHIVVRRRRVEGINVDMKKSAMPAEASGEQGRCERKNGSMWRCLRAPLLTLRSRLTHVAISTVTSRPTCASSSSRSARVAPSTARASTSSRTSPSAPKIPSHFVALLDQASWAAPRLAPMIRMALGFAVRRGLAAAVYHWWRRSHAFVQRPPAPPSPTIVLLPPADA